MINGVIYVEQTKPHTRWLLGPHNLELAKVGIPKFILKEVEPLDYAYFFGSRSKMFIDPDNKESDWDFAIPSNYNTEKLIDMGFILKNDQYPYEDGVTFEVYEKEVQGHTIQLVLKANLPLFRHIWESISQEFYERFINKRSKHYLGKEWVQKWFKIMQDVSRDKVVAYEDMI